MIWPAERPGFADHQVFAKADRLLNFDAKGALATAGDLGPASGQRAAFLASLRFSRLAIGRACGRLSPAC